MFVSHFKVLNLSLATVDLASLLYYIKSSINITKQLAIMFRWHRKSCRRPDVVVAGDLPYCCNCDSSAELPPAILTQNAPISNSISGSERCTNLYWPSSVSYSTEDSDANSEGLEPLLVDELDFPTPGTTTNGVWDNANPATHEGVPRNTLEPCITGLFPKLTQKYDIRLLKLSGSSQSDILHGKLESTDLVESPLFEAVSYTWGGEDGIDDKCKTIYIGPWFDVMTITYNCDLALRQLRSKGHRILWVDSICINQRDTNERSNQVSILRDIFSKASRVLMYLGPSMKHSDDAMQALVAISSLKSHEPDAKLTHLEGQAIDNLFLRRYFSRIWVIQEVAVARKVIMYCGDLSLTWSSFNTLRIPKQNFDTIPKWLLEYSQLEMGVTARPKDLLALLDATSNCSSKDPRDKVFAILGLVSGAMYEGLTPDYNLSLERLYTGVATYLLLRQGNAKILSYPRSALTSLPSWVPDWSADRAHLIEAPVDMDFESHTRPLKKEGGTELHDVVWLSGQNPLWTVFTTDIESPRIWYTQPLVSQDFLHHNLVGIPKVDAETGALAIEASIITELKKFYHLDPLNLRRSTRLHGSKCDFHWVVKLEFPGDTVTDSIAYIPGCRSYLHLRRETSRGYRLIGKCDLGFQSFYDVAEWNLSSETLASVRRLIQVKGNDGMDEVPPHDEKLMGGFWGVELSFLSLQHRLLNNNFGTFLRAQIDIIGGYDSQTNTDPSEEFFDLGDIDGFIWDTMQGWTTTICRLNAPNFPSEHATWDKTVIETLDFWSDDRVWEVVEDLDKWMVQIRQLKADWMEWVQLGKDLVNAIYDFDHLHDHNAVQLAGAEDTDYHHHHQASLRACGLISPTIDAAKEAWIASTQQFLVKFSTVPLVRNSMTAAMGGEGVSDPLKRAEHTRLSALFTEALQRMPLRTSYIPQTTYTLCAAMAVKISLFEWVQCSWWQFMTGSRDFQLVCQHLRAVKTFQAGIGPLQEIVIV